MGVQEIVAALPSEASGDEPQSDLLRTELVQGMVGFIPDDASVVTGVMQVDPVDAALGGVRQAYVYGDGTFKYDELDTTTAHDGVFVLNLIGGHRYKRLGVPVIGAVKSRSVETPPDPADVDPENRPQLGDAYLFLTGSWAAEGVSVNEIAVWSSIGGGSWQAVEPTFGPPLYIEDEDSYVHWAGDDGWIDGLGGRTYPASSIPQSALIWDERVENQTTNAPPSAAQGTAYIIGSSPTGAWAGNAGKLAIREAAGTGSTYVIYPHVVGREVYDKSLGIKVRWTGTAWESAAGSIVGSRTVLTNAATDTTFVAGSDCEFSLSLTPTTSSRRRTDDKTITYAAKTVGNVLEIEWSGFIVCVGDAPVAVALFRDSESNALEWLPVLLVNNNTIYVRAKFHIPVADKASHEYKIAVTTSGAGAIYPNSFNKRRFTLKEVAEN